MRSGEAMQTKRLYQVQAWLHGQWSREHNWCKVEAFSEEEAAQKVCGVALATSGKLAQLRARVLTLGDRSKAERHRFMQSSATTTRTVEVNAR
jgi:hypothetical protein